MKKVKFITSLLIGCACVAACSDDDNAPVDHAAKVVGSYAGTAELKMNGQVLGTIDACTVILTRVDENTVTARMDSVRYDQMLLTSVTAEAVITPSTPGGNYTIAGSATPTGEIYSGVSFSGTVDGTRANLEITVTVPAMPLPVIVAFEGSQGRGTVTVDASDYTKWVYFSFERGATVAVTNPANDLSWDIALHRYDLQTNGGVSGNGQGGALATTGTKLNEVTTVPNGTFVEDVEAEIMIAMPPAYAAGSKNEVLAAWLTMDTSVMPPPPPTYSKLVYIVRTASGKHVKVLFTDYTNAEGTPGHVTFSYEVM